MNLGSTRKNGRPKYYGGQLEQGLSPLLKWAGGKSSYPPEVIAQLAVIAKGRPWVDLFCGGLGLPQIIQPKRATLNDSNPHLINLYKCVQSGLLARFDPTAWDLTHEGFLIDRAELNAGGLNSVRVAELFYRLNRTAFRGLTRYSAKSGYNVPPERSARPVFCKDFGPYQQLFGENDWQFTCGDWSQATIRSGDFVFADPPYVDDESTGTISFRGYQVGGFSWTDQIALADRLGLHDGPVVATNHWSTALVKAYEERGFECQQLVIRPRAMGPGSKKKRVIEMLATKNCRIDLKDG